MKTLTLIKVSIASIAVTLVLSLPAFGKEEEQDIKLSDCPAAVQKTIKDNAGDGVVGDVEKETKKDGSVVYEADVKMKDGSKVEIQVSEAGKLIKVGKEEDEKEGEGKEDKD